MRVLSFAIGAVIASLAGWAEGAEPSARELYERGAQAYRESRHDEAAALFRQAFELEPHAELAYNLGRALEAAGHLRSAVQSFRDYLRLAPDAKDRPEIERRIENLERRLNAPRETTPSAAPLAGRPQSTAAPVVPVASQTSTPAAPPPDDRSAVRLPTWIALGVGAGALGTALGFEFARSSAVKDVESSQTQLEHRDRYQEAEKNRDLARVFAGVGAAAVLTGGILLYFDLSGRERTSASLPSGSTARAGATFTDRGTFCFVGGFQF
jgi:tetratricopeptide (TPR) repeat protein